MEDLKAESTQIRKRAAEALILIDSPRAVVPLCESLKDKRGEISMAAAVILSRMTDNSIPGRVYELMKSNSQLNATASYVLGFKKFKEAADLIRERLQDVRQPGQDQMAESLGWLDDHHSVPLLIKV